MYEDKTCSLYLATKLTDPHPPPGYGMLPVPVLMQQARSGLQMISAK
jgi:hypothetical protein